MAWSLPRIVDITSLQPVKSTNEIHLSYSYEDPRPVDERRMKSLWGHVEYRGENVEGSKRRTLLGSGDAEFSLPYDKCDEFRIMLSIGDDTYDRSDWMSCK